MYRAFFDTADWISIQLRNLIITELENYDSDCIKKTVPNYYSEIRPDIVQINEDIAKARNNKDVTSKTGTIEQVKKYRKLIDKLSKYYKKVTRAKDSLEEINNEQKRKSKAKITIQIVIGLLIAAVSTFLGAIFF